MKKIYILAFLSLFAFIPSVLAHSSLESSVPQDGEVITENLSTLTLTFNTLIEVTSSFKLINKSGQDIPMESIQVKNNEMIGNLSSPLKDGKYIVNWKIIGEDGHPIENSYSFLVDTSSGNNTSEVSSEPVLEEKMIENGDEIIENEAPTSNNFLVVTAILLIIVALGTSFWLLKRGKK
ncbi:copper resistance CopC family protein [Solibacillus silvestris]